MTWAAPPAGARAADISPAGPQSPAACHSAAWFRARRARASARRHPPAPASQEALVRRRVARQRLDEHFTFLHRRHPGLAVQLLLDQAPDWRRAMARLQALTRQQLQLAERGFTSQVMWATANELEHQPTDLEDAYATLATWLCSPDSSDSLKISRRELSMLCAVSCSLRSLSELHLNGRGICDTELALELPQLAELPGIRLLSLIDNQLTDESMPIFYSLLPVMPVLGSILLAGNFISQAANNELAHSLAFRLKPGEARDIDDSRHRHSAVAQLMVDAPLQASLGYVGARVAQQLSAQTALLGRLRRLRLEGIRWTRESLEVSLSALAQARSLCHLTLEISPWIMPWGEMLAPLGELMGLQVLGLGHSALPHDDLVTLACRAPEHLLRLCRLELGVPTPAWAQAPRAQKELAVLDGKLVCRRPPAEPPPLYLDPAPDSEAPASKPPSQPPADFGAARPPRVSPLLHPQPYPHELAGILADQISGRRPIDLRGAGDVTSQMLVLQSVPGQPSKVMVGATRV